MNIYTHTHIRTQTERERERLRERASASASEGERERRERERENTLPSTTRAPTVTNQKGECGRTGSRTYDLVGKSRDRTTDLNSQL